MRPAPGGFDPAVGLPPLSCWMLPRMPAMALNVAPWEARNAAMAAALAGTLPWPPPPPSPPGGDAGPQRGM